METRGSEAGPYSIGSGHWPALSKLAEECGEVLQVVGKILGAGGSVDHWDGAGPLDQRLVDEMGDLAAAIEVVLELNQLDRSRWSARRVAKCNQFVQWHEDQSRAS